MKHILYPTRSLALLLSLAAIVPAPVATAGIVRIATYPIRHPVKTIKQGPPKATKWFWKIV